MNLYPRPVQKRLPLWLTAAGSEQTFSQAGEWGVNVLTALMGQDVDQLRRKIEVYRAARAAAGFDARTGIVTVMLHTFVGSSEDEVLRVAEPAFKRYLETHVEFAALRLSKEERERLNILTDADRQAILNRSVKRYRRGRSLMGTAGYCEETLRSLAHAGVDEVACLLDFGIDSHAAMASLERFAELAAPSLRPELARG